MTGTLLKYLICGLIVAIITATILKYASDFKMDDNKIIKASLVAGFGIALIVMTWDYITRRSVEKMEQVSRHIQESPHSESEQTCPDVSSCEPPSYMPRAYLLNRRQEDAANTGLTYNNDYPYQVLLQKGQFEKGLPPFSEVRDVVDHQRYNFADYTKHMGKDGYFMANNGYYTESKGIPYDKAPQVICNSKLEDLYEQDNYNIKGTPHTHYGKARGYMNWQGVYPN